MVKLEAEMRPLQESNADLSEQNGMLQAEQRLLEEDLKRWKNRTQVCTSTLFEKQLLQKVVKGRLWLFLCVQQVLSQQKDSNQEESKKLQTEKEAQVRRIQQLTEETGKLKSELARSVTNSLRDNVLIM